MPKKKQPQTEEDTAVAIDTAIEETIQPAEAKEVAADPIPYEKVEWKPGIHLFHCKICSLDLNDEDDMILHILIHFPEAQHQDILDSLVKEIENGSD